MMTLERDQIARQSGKGETQDKTASVSDSPEFAGYVAGLAKIAEDLVSYGKWIKQCADGEDGNLPTVWDLEEVIINYKKIVRPE